MFKAWLNDMEMGVGETPEEAIQDALREAHEQGLIGGEYPRFPTDDDFLAELSVEECADEDEKDGDDSQESWAVRTNRPIYQEGARVRHPELGEGEIIKVEHLPRADRLTVRFGDQTEELYGHEPLKGSDDPKMFVEADPAPFMLRAAYRLPERLPYAGCGNGYIVVDMESGEVCSMSYADDGYSLVTEQNVLMSEDAGKVLRVDGKHVVVRANFSCWSACLF